MSEAVHDPNYLRSTYAVWEITLKCNLGCIHCGSRAGDARSNELDTAEALDLVGQLADVGVGEVSLIGGESFLRPDWLDIAREIRKQGMRLTMTTGGFGLGPKLAEQMADVGFSRVSVSIDGLEQTHDYLRGKKDSWKWCFKAIESLQNVGIEASTNTQINRLNAPELPRLYELIHKAGVRVWQVQKTSPMGNAADRPEIIFQPYDLLELFPVLHYILLRGLEEDFQMAPSDSLGYFGPYERRFRQRQNTPNPDTAFWVGDLGGVLSLGIESDGTIKADPSLPTDDYAGGNIREKSLKEIIYEADRLAINDERTLEHLWGFCKSCEFAEICRAGQVWSSHVFFDRRGNNPLCHHRSLIHAAQGLQEHLRLVERAEGLPFDNGVFEISVEKAAEISVEKAAGKSPGAFTIHDVNWPEAWLEADPDLPAKLQAERDRSIEVWRQTRLPKMPGVENASA